MERNLEFSESLRIVSYPLFCRLKGNIPTINFFTLVFLMGSPIVENVKILSHFLVRLRFGSAEDKLNELGVYRQLQTFKHIIMEAGNTIFKSLEPDDVVPENLKGAIISEIDTLRDSIVLINHFTQNCLKSLSACFLLSQQEGA